MEEKTLCYYDNNALEISRRYEQVDFSPIQKVLLTKLPRRKRVLEVGCGSGRDASFLVSHGLDVTATDGSSAMLTQAKRLHPELRGRLVHHRLPDDLPFDDQAFNAAFTIAVLMHLKRDDIAVAIQEVHRVLGPSGLLFFSVPLKRPELGEGGLDERGRRFTSLSEAEWREISCACGFLEIHRATNRDSLDREGIVWGNFLMEKTR